MLMNKGKEWALSCATVSAAILMGMCTTVHADATTDTDNTATTSEVSQDTSSNQDNSSKQDASSSLDDVTTSNNDNTPVAQVANEDVQDGGNVEDDFPNVNNDLGYASRFHIFANEATLNAHTNGNIAVGTLNGNVNFGTNVHEGHVNTDVSYVQNINTMANSSFVNQSETRTNKVIFGENNDVDVSNENRTNVNGINVDHLTKNETHQDKDGNQYINFKEYFGTLENKSVELTNKTPQVSVSNSDFPDQNQRVINLEDYEVTADNKIVIDLDPDVLAMDRPLTIYGLSSDAGGTNIVFNVDTKGNKQYEVNSQIKLIYNDGTTNNNVVERPNQETEYFDDNHILWNFYDSTASDKLYDGNIDIKRPFQGSILAPKATVTVDANLDGNIVADKVIINAESHRWDYQDNSTTETEYEKPITIPGELPELPGEENNNGGNIENPNEKEEEEDIDPDTGELVEGGHEGTDPEPEIPVTPVDPEKPTTPTEPETPTTTPSTDDNNETDESEDNTDGEGDLIIHGGSEGTEPESNQSDDTLNNGLLSGVVGNNNDSSQTPTASNNSGSLPQTGETTGIVATLLKAVHIKKED